MNLAEALKELYAGKKIRRKAWAMNVSYQLKNETFINLSPKDLLAEDWEAVRTEYLLSKKEKEYLNNLISLYLHNYDFVFERELIHKQYFLKIAIFPWNHDKKAEYISLPLSVISGNMFSELEENHPYTADDLELFKE